MLNDAKLKVDITGQTAYLYADRPIWLEDRNVNIRTCLAEPCCFAISRAWPNQNLVTRQFVRIFKVFKVRPVVAIVSS